MLLGQMIPAADRMPDKYFFLRLPGAILWIVEKLTNVELVRGLIRHKWSQLATDKQILKSLSVGEGTLLARSGRSPGHGWCGTWRAATAGAADALLSMVTAPFALSRSSEPLASTG